MFNLFDKKNFIINSAIFLISLFSILTVLFPYQVQSFVFDKIQSIFNFKKDYVRIINTHSDDEIYKLLIEALEKSSLEVREVHCEKNLLPYQMLLRNKADLTIIPGFISAMNSGKLYPVTTTTPSHLIILAPKNYQIKEFAQLADRKVGVKDNDETGIIILKKLIQIYSFDLPPVLVEENIKSIEKTLRDGIVECVIWIENIYSPEAQKFLRNSDYNIIEVSLSNILTKTLPGLHIKTINLSPNEQDPKTIIEIDNVMVTSNKLNKKIVRKIINAIMKPEVFSKISYDQNFPSIPYYLSPHPELEKLIRSKNISSTQLKMILISFFFLLLSISLLRYLVKRWRKNKEKLFSDEFEKTLSELKKVNSNLTISSSIDDQLNSIKIIKSAMNWGIQNYNLNKINSYQLILLLHKIIQTTLPFIEKYLEWNLKKSQIEEIENKIVFQQEVLTQKIKQANMQVKPLEGTQLMLFDLPNENDNSNPSSLNKKEEE